MTDTLYIIGNGFDLHHGIRSSYKAFGEYLKSHDRNTYEVIERHLGVYDDLWAEFEQRLADLDRDDLMINYASFWLESYDAEDWRDAYHHDYQYEIGRVVEAISETLGLRFGEWIRQLRIPDPSEIVRIRLTVDGSATYLNFNYTPSLQRLYGVPDARILHIHGAAMNADLRLILGHGRQPEKNPDPSRFERDPEDAADMRIVEGHAIIDKYFQETFKPTAEIIRDNAAFFGNLSSVRRIFVMGHSVSRVDHPYFREVIRNIDPGRVTWKISYFDDLKALRERVAELGIATDLVEFARLTDF
jgi:hypothetical protein